MTDLSDLIARVEGLVRPDREIGHALVVALALAPSGMEYCGPLGDGTHYWGGGGNKWDEPDYTGSLDSALALVERATPALLPSIARYSSGRWEAALGHEPYTVQSTADGEWYGLAPTPALALLSALLRALAAKEPS